MNDSGITVKLTQQQDYRFLIEFGEPVPSIIGDEPSPLGGSTGPSPVQLLAAAIGNCLSDSLLFALRKFKQSPEPVHTQVQAITGRNPEGRIRVLKIIAEITLGTKASELEHLERALDQFESFCTVTQSVRQGIPIEVRVLDANGDQIK